MDGKPLAIEVVGKVFVCDQMATFWKKVKLIITKHGSWTLISPRDQKCISLLERTYWTFLGKEKYHQGHKTDSPHQSGRHDSGVSEGSESESEVEGQECAAHLAVVISQEFRFETPLPSDMVEVKEGKNHIDVTLGSAYEDENSKLEAYCDTVLGCFGSHFA